MLCVSSFRVCCSWRMPSGVNYSAEPFWNTLQILQTTLQKNKNKTEIEHWVREMYKLYLLPYPRSTLTLFSETPDSAVSVFMCRFAKRERPTRSDISQHGLVLSGKHKMHLKRFCFWRCKPWLKWPWLLLYRFYLGMHFHTTKMSSTALQYLFMRTTEKHGDGPRQGKTCY